MREPARRSRVPIGLLLAAFASAPLLVADAAAQSCAAPLNIAPNTPYVFDTCSGDVGLSVACGMFALTGPAGIVHLSLPYPAGTLLVTPFSATYDPALFLLQTRCGSAAWCGAVVDDAPQGGSESMALGDVDSGEYYLAISTWYDPTAAACGPVMISYELMPEQQALANDGVFRSGITALPDP
ncbi:hypothetical protein [Dokdonella sp.]|uniref:hypothetical protein n=1 Tax=Dokdonella sp. TaxID=2291710 RepID=UPI001AFCF1DC|nr:hypothetical protein [Dokdonella sp.]MBO9664340.1 hypothetical protein [Dokdonella sp.]